VILRDLPRTHLDRLAPALLADHTLILLVPATADGDWAVAAAWDVARAAAAGRRVALVDLQLEQPALDARADVAAAEGIVDAFEFGVSLTHVACPQHPATLHFIPVGTAPSSAAAVWGNPRWERLRRGFEREGALLLAYAPAHALRELAARPDGVLVLAPRGYDPETQPLPALQQAGIAILGVVRDDPAPARRPAPLPTGYDGRPPAVEPIWTAHLSRESARRAARDVGRRVMGGERRFGSPLQRGAVVGGAVVLIAILIFTLRPPGAERRAPSAGESPGTEGQAPSTEAPPSAERQASSTPQSAPPADTLFYSAQVAAFSQLEQAMAHAAGLEEPGRPAFVTPVVVGRNATLWYRVLVGALETADAAEALLRDLWSSGDAVRGQGTILRTAQALEVGAHADPGDARAAARALRARGVPAYIVPGPDGGARVLVGAFETPDQARVADSLLARAGVSGSLVTRTGLSITR
jgi:cell division septation protein DedD